MQELLIGQLAKAANVSIDTIRFYEKCGLMPQPARRSSGFREYSQHHLRQLKLVLQARSLGFSIEEISEILGQRDGAAASDVVERSLAVVNRRIHALRRCRRVLLKLERVSAGRENHGLSRHKLAYEQS